MWIQGLLCVVSIVAANGVDVPKWSEVYSVSGTIFHPHSDIEEPFSAWYDGPNKRSRIDYYNGTTKTYQIGKVDKEYGEEIKIVPVTTETEQNVPTCFRKDSKEVPQSLVPDLTGFEYLGEEFIGGVQTQIWNLTFIDKPNKYHEKIWVYFRGDDPSEGTKVAVPIKYEIKVYNVMSGRLNHNYMEYKEFDNKPIEETIFEIESNITCHAFHGLDGTMNPMAEFITPGRQDHVDFEFDKFTKKHRKNYNSTEEATSRKENFRRNLRYIQSHNRKNTGYTLAVNHLADKSDNELKVLRGKLYSGEYNGGLPFPYTSKDYADLPDQWDWRLYGAVTPVKDQSDCGSCWSFGAVGTIEGALFLKNGENLTLLSEQALIDCSWGYRNNGCDGGTDFRSYQWMLKHGGIPTHEDYGPYLAQDGICHVDQVPKVAKLSGWVNVTTNDENALRLAIFKHGPVSVAIDASHKSFHFYSRGVYYEETCGNTEQQLNHAVLAVGYGSLNGENYWLIKNSWSSNWGIDGYMLMSSKDNNCGVMTTPTYVNLE